MKSLRLLIVAGAVLSTIVVATASEPALAQTPPSTLEVTKNAPGQVLAGKNVPYSVSARNNGTAALYNLTFRDVLPLGVTYVAPTSPADAGEPEIIVNQVPDLVAPGQTIPQQTLIWSNVGDLQVGDTFQIAFSVALNATVDPVRPSLPVYAVGSIVNNNATGFASANPRVLQSFTATGEPIPNSQVQTDTDAGQPTLLTAIEIRKSEPSPEGELLRGVHDHDTVYTLSLEVTGRAGVNDVVVTDYLPAELEFLGCGAVDNTPLLSPRRPEYPGAPLLTGTPTPAGCEFPALVETVVDPPPQRSTSYPPGVYTKLTWNLGNQPSGTVINLPYAAGIPLNANTPFPDPAPTPDSGQQASNLGNNTGPSTRELTTESAITNVARSSGVYQGTVAPGSTVNVFDDTRLTRTFEDVRIRKTIRQPIPNVFRTGAIAIYDITVDVSEYVDASDVVLTDQVPNGLCPLGAISYPSTDNPGPCEARGPGSLDLPSIPFASVTPTAGGGFTTVFQPIPATETERNDSTVVTYSAYMRGVYEGGPNSGRPPVSGDSFTNTVSSASTTTPIPATPETGAIAGITDGSSATLISNQDSIDKLVRPRDATPRLLPGEDCPGVSAPIPPGQYIDSNTVPPALQEARLGFRLGDQICFLLTVDFDPTIKTRNAVVTDFLPAGVNYVPGSLQTTVNNIRVDPNFVPPANPAGPLEFPLGTDDPNIPGTDRYVDLDATFQVVFKGVVVDIPDNDTPTITGNLMKMRTENTAGQARSFRDRQPLGIVPAPPVQIRKGVASVDVPPFTTTLPNQDGKEVREGSTATFRVDVTNNGTSVTFTNYSVRGLDIWDVLPAGITCAQISAITAFDGASASGIATCTNPGQSGHPTFEGNTRFSAIRWVFPVDPADPDVWQVAPLQTRTLTYRMLIPTPTSISTTFVNNSAIRSYQAFTNVEGVRSTYYPADNIDTSVTPAQENADEASDPSNVFTPGARTTKTGNTGIVESNNDLPTQAVPGETITYTYAVDIPPNTSTFSGVLRDILPTQVEIVTPAPVARFYPDAATAVTTALPPGFSLSPTGTLTFPTTYTNPTSTPQRFEVVLTTRVKPSVTTQVTITDTARFTSLTTVGGAPIVTPDATYINAIRQPSPSIGKANDAPLGSVVGGQTVEYTLTGRNASGRPPLHNAILSDCIPAGLTFVAFGPTTPAGTTTGPVAGNPAAGGNGCATGTTFIAFSVGTIAANGSAVRTYTAQVEATAVGGNTYTNTAGIVGSSLNNGVNDPLVEGVYRPAPTTNTVAVPGAALSKVVTPTRATVGDVVTYTVTVTAPVDTNFYQAAIRDRLPAGIDPTTLDFISATCESLPNAANPSPTPCDPSTTFFLPEPAIPATSPPTYVTGAYFGDVLAAPYERRFTIRYRARLADVQSNVAGATVSNQAQSVWDSAELPDPTSANYPWNRAGIAQAANVRVLEPSVTLAKSVSDTTPDPGDLFTYTLTLTNAAGEFVSPAYNTTIVDVVPAGVEILESTIDPTPTRFEPPTAGAAGSITWGPGVLVGPLAPGASVPLSYQARLFPSPEIDAAPRPNTVNLQRYEGLPAGVDAQGNRRLYTGNQATATVTPQFPKLATVKVASGEPAYIGSEYVWRVTITNTGNAPAFGVSIQDQVPTNWTYVANSSLISPPAPEPPFNREPIVGTGGACPVGRSCWLELGRLGPGESLTLTYRAVPQPDVVITPGVGSAIRQVNTASATGFDATAATGNLTGPYGSGDVTASTRIDKADLVLDKSSTGIPVAGRDFSWTINVRNKSGVDTAVGPFVVADTLPAGVVFVSAAGTGWTCASSGGPPPTTVTCQRSTPGGTLPPGAAFSPITVTVAIPADFVAPPAFTRDITNTASVTMRTYEVTPADNTDSDTVGVTTEADLRTVKQRTAPIVAGLDTTYTLDVSNLGPSVSRAPITVRDPIPPGTTFESVTAGPGWLPCGLGTGPDVNVLVCTFNNDLAVGGVAPQIAVTVAVGSGVTGDVTNTATVTGTTPDPVPGNNTSTVPGTVGTEADLRIDKQATGPITAGQPVTYRIRVDNDGPSDAIALTITDALPPGLTFVSADSVVPDEPNGWTCPTAVGSTSFTCTLPALAADAFATVDIVAFVDPSVPADQRIVNEATVGSQTPDPDLSNNTDRDQSIAGTEADLRIVKMSTGSAVAGENFTWTLQVSNLGPSDSQPAITVSDRLPVGTEFVSATGTDWTCIGPVSPSRVVTCNRTIALAAGTPLAPTDAPPITLVVRVLPEAGPGTMENFAGVRGVTNDPNLANNDDSNEVRIDDLVELSIVKTTTGDNPASAGTSTAFTVVVTNEGPSVADNLVVSDIVPGGLTATSASGTGWDCAIGRTVVCRRDSLGLGAAPPIVLIASIAPSVPDNTTITNTARVSTSTPEIGAEPNEDSSDVLILASADLAIVKTHTGPVRIGNELDFTLVVTNGGPSTAVDVVVDDSLPADLTPVRASGAGWVCDPIVGQVVRCALAGPLGPLAAAEIVVTALVGPAAFPEMTNTAVVSSATPDPNLDNNTSRDPVEVPALVDLTIVKTHAEPVAIGQPIVYTLVVGNNGPIDDTEAITVFDTLPDSLTPVSAASVAAACGLVGQTITCTKADGLAVGDTFEVTITATVLPASYPTVANTATVSSPTDDRDPANNTSTDTASVPPLVDLTITKTHVDPVAVGGTITYTVTVRNAGPTADPGPIRITDALPDSLTPVSASGAGLVCSIGGQTVSCVSEAPLPVGGSLVATIVANVLGTAAPTVVNTAVVETPSPETDAGNNQATDTAAVSPLVLLRLTKSLVSQIGLNATWSFDVANVGLNATSQPIVLTDPLPPALVYVSAGGPGWSCGNAFNVVTCTYGGVVPPGTSAPALQLVTLVVSSPGASIVNVATVEGGGPSVPPSIDSGLVTAPPLGLLPSTGGDPNLLLRVAPWLVAVGLVLLVATRRRYPRQQRHQRI